MWHTERVHTRRLATFLLGVWLGCSFFMAFIALENMQSSDLVMNSASPAAGRLVKTLGPQQVELLIKHHSAELNRHYFGIWENAQIVIALVLAGCLYLATQRRPLPLLLVGIMFMMVVFQHFGITPELAYRGRETDFPPGNAVFGALARVWTLQQLFIVTEVAKLLVGGILTSYLFAFRSKSKYRSSSRREADLVDDPEYRHAEGEF